jgi:hypothetical protein
VSDGDLKKGKTAHVTRVYGGQQQYETHGLEAFCLFIYYYSLRFFLIVSLDSLIFHYPAITKTKQMEYYGWRQNALIRSLFLFCFAVAICFHAFSVLLFCFVYCPDFRPLVISRSGDID